MTGRGRPTTGTKVQVRIPANLLATIDAEARKLGVPRAEVIRRNLATIDPPFKCPWCLHSDQVHGPNGCTRCDCLHSAAGEVTS